MSSSLRFLLIALPVVISACGSAQLAPQSRPTATGPLVHLPADQAAHPGVANEWWYVVGHMRSGGRTFGYEVTTFRFSHLRLPGAAARSLTSTLYRTDVAITDESRKSFHQRVTYYFPESASVSTRTLRVKVGTVSLQGATPSSMSLKAGSPSGAIDLHLASKRAAMYVGGRGYLKFANGYTYYYSLTDLAASGTIRVGRTTFSVTGISWLDHQWGDWTWTKGGGWTWMALQLSNGVQLSLFDVRSNGSRVREASVLLANGKLKTVGGLTIVPHAIWHSPHTGGAYPSGWTVQLPALRATLTVNPTLRDQEVVDRTQAAGSYWEGSGRVSGSFEGKHVTGLSYTELTGYVHTKQ